VALVHSIGVAVAVAAILAMLAVPSITGLIQRTRLDSQANELGGRFISLCIGLF
jgi:Tfp pilus assembly protein FimT